MELQLKLYSYRIMLSTVKKQFTCIDKTLLKTVKLLISNYKSILWYQNDSFRLQIVKIRTLCLKNVIICYFVHGPKMKQIIIFVNDIFIRFRSCHRWVDFKWLNSKTFWYCNADSPVINCWKLRNFDDPKGYIFVLGRIRVFLR